MKGWEQLHAPESSWRKQLVGRLNEAFFVPRYVELFYQRFGSERSLACLELGSGTGDISQAILARNQGQIARYVVSENFEEGVAWLREAGLETLKLDACATGLPDRSFDTTLSWDVMHHVADPRAMAREMMRVSRGRCLLVESNGRSVFRKLKELTPAYRTAGETSHSPHAWRSFFEGHYGFQIRRFEIFPMLFPIPCPRFAMPLAVAFNRWIERAPFLRWQCSSVAIYLEYERVPGKDDSDAE